MGKINTMNPLFYYFLTVYLFNLLAPKFQHLLIYVAKQTFIENAKYFMECS